MARGAGQLALGLLQCSFPSCTILVLLMNQNVLSVIKTICLLYAFLLEKPVVLGTLGIAQGHSDLMSTFHPWSKAVGRSMRAVVCLHFQGVTETETVGRGQGEPIL